MQERGNLGSGITGTFYFCNVGTLLNFFAFPSNYHYWYSQIIKILMNSSLYAY